MDDKIQILVGFFLYFPSSLTWHLCLIVYVKWNFNGTVLSVCAFQLIGLYYPISCAIDCLIQYIFLLLQSKCYTVLMCVSNSFPHSNFFFGEGHFSSIPFYFFSCNPNVTLFGCICILFQTFFFHLYLYLESIIFLFLVFFFFVQGNILSFWLLYFVSNALFINNN